MSLGFGVLLGIIAVLIINQLCLSKQQRKDQQAVHAVHSDTSILNIFLYDAFMAIAAYMNVFFCFVIEYGEFYGDWSDCVSAVLYFLIFILFHKIFQMTHKNSDMTDALYVLCYRSMLVVQSCFLLYLKKFEIAAITLTFLCGELFSVSLHHNRKVLPKAFFKWLDMKIQAMKNTDRTQLIHALLAVLFNILLGFCTLDAADISFNPKMIAAGFAVSAASFSFVLRIFHNKSKAKK